MPLPPLYLVRHGQTDWNAEGRFQGQRDTALNATGRLQARRNGRQLKDLLAGRAADFDFLASPLSRTRETMEIIRAELGLDPAYRTDERLLEVHFGQWQGSTLAEIGETSPHALAEREADKWNFLPAGENAESYELLARRVKPVFEALTRPSVIVAHGGIARVFLQCFGGRSETEAAYLSIPQDRILRFENRAFAWV